jgi:hypothetical protein
MATLLHQPAHVLPQINLSLEHNLTRLAIDDGHAHMFRPVINPHRKWADRVINNPLESDGEWNHLHYHGLALIQQASGPGRIAG